MRLTRLSLENIRAIREAELKFDPQFNLIVGLNGVGKSTVLDAIRICASKLLPVFGVRSGNKLNLESSDIADSTPVAEIALEFFLEERNAHTIDSATHGTVLLREWRERVIKDDPKNVERLRREILKTQRPRDRLRNQLRELQTALEPSTPIHFFPSEKVISDLATNTTSAPLIIHYSTLRSAPTERVERTSASRAPAYVAALDGNQLNLRSIADWLRAQRKLAREDARYQKRIDAVNAAVSLFLPGYSRLRLARAKTDGILINRDDVRLNVRQLSDGERSVLSLILDISKRLALANPDLASPAEEAGAVILIDEIDLHLHPQWQRKIAANLMRTFPKCQFIATTHSPQVIGELPSHQIQIIKGGKVFNPPRSFGIDSSRVLEEVMDADARNTEVEARIDRISNLIAEGRRNEAQGEIKILAALIGESDPEITRAQTLIDFLESDE